MVTSDGEGAILGQKKLMLFWFWVCKRFNYVTFHKKVTDYALTMLLFWKSNRLRFKDVSILKRVTDYALTTLLFKVMMPSFGVPGEPPPEHPAAGEPAGRHRPADPRLQGGWLQEDAQ